MIETERQLLDAIHCGDRQALRRLYDRYSGYAMAIGLRYVPERDDVRDILQDSFINILTSINEFDYRGEGSLKAWISRIVANRAIDWLKEHERLHFTDEIPDAAEEGGREVENVPPDILNSMIGQLPGGCRMVLNLYVFEQLSHKEIAQRLGIRENSSASQLSRAKKILAEMVKEYLYSQSDERERLEKTAIRSVVRL